MYDEGGQLIGLYNFLLYERMDKSYIDEEIVALNMIGGQRHIWCAAHEEEGVLVHSHRFVISSF